MRSKKIFHFSTSFTALFLAVFMIGSVDQSIVTPEKSKTNEPTVVSTSPSDGDEDVARNAVIEVTFSETVDSEFLQNATFTLMHESEAVEGTFEYSGNKGTFTTKNSLHAESDYTATLSMHNNQPENETSENEFNEEESEGNEENEFDDEENEAGTVDNSDKEWSFTTGGNREPVATVDLGSAANYVILAQTSIQNDSTSEITGERGFDPEFKSSKDSKDKEDKTAYWLDNEDVDKEEVRREKEEAKKEKEEVEKAKEEARTEANREMSDNSTNNDYTANEGDANADNLDEALEDMISAYNDAAERTSIDFVDYKFNQSDDQAEANWSNDRDDQSQNEMNSTESTWEDEDQDESEEDNNEEYNEDYNAESDMENNSELDNNRVESEMNDNTNESAVTLEPGIYKWNDSVEISSNITLSGDAEDVWIFQISEGLTVDRDVEITLGNGVEAENVIWQVAGEVNIGEASHFEGVILSLSGITMKDGASLNGRMLAQTVITLNENTIMEPQVFASARTSTNE